MTRLTLLALIAIFIGGCAANRSSPSIEPTKNASEANATTLRSAPTIASDIFVKQGKIHDRAYITLGPIEVSVSKTVIFGKDPTIGMINDQLKQEAAKLGADAVILVTYGTVNASSFFCRTLDGKGVAIKFIL
jgi:hypothetical protein